MPRTAATIPAQAGPTDTAAADNAAPAHTNGNVAWNSLGLSDTALVIDPLVANAAAALAAYADFTQDQIDFIVKKAAVAALAQHGELAQAAVAETGRGVFEDKAVKNIFVSEQITHSLQYLKTVGVISNDEISGIVEIAEPVGVVCGITPGDEPDLDRHLQEPDRAEDPQSDHLRVPPGRPAVLAPQAARVVRDAAIAAGAPENCIQWIEHPSIEATDALMHHPGVALILATGGNAMVKAAYSLRQARPRRRRRQRARLHRAHREAAAGGQRRRGLEVVRQRHGLRLRTGRHPGRADLRGGHGRVRQAARLPLQSPGEGRCWSGSCSASSADGADCSGAKLNAAVVGQSPEWIAEHAGFAVPRGHLDHPGRGAVGRPGTSR